MVNIKSEYRLVSVTIITFVVVFICTIFINYPLDLKEIEYLMTSSEMREAFLGVQVSLADVIIAATVGLFGSMAALILMFSIRQFINENSAELGVLKALGYSENRIAFDFSKFGLCVLAGSVLGYLLAYLASPAFYDMLTSDYVLPAEVVFRFRPDVFAVMIVMPTVSFSVLAVLYARLRLRKRPLALIIGEDEVKVGKRIRRLQSKEGNLTFLGELRRMTFFNNLILVFFVGFAAFVFAAQVQTAFTVRQLVDNALMTSTFIISGLVVGSATLLLALTFLVDKNKKHVALLKAYGYTEGECGKAMFGGYRMVTYIGFALGTCYQFLFIAFVIARAFDSVAVTFDFVGLLVALPTFIVAYELLMLFYRRRMAKIPFKEIMQS